MRRARALLAISGLTTTAAAAALWAAGCGTFDVDCLQHGLCSSFREADAGDGDAEETDAGDPDGAASASATGPESNSDIKKIHEGDRINTVTALDLTP